MMNAAQVQQQLQRGQALAQAGRMGEAWALLAPLRPAIDTHGGALRLVALVAQQAGQSDAAIDALRRICALEGNPTDILGATADTLGRAGRHDEAYATWSALVAKDPGAVDAHLNRAIAADRAGQHDEAVAAADAGLQHHPSSARLAAIKATALKNSGRLSEALPAFAHAVALDPTRALTRVNQGISLRAAGLFDEACDAYDHAARLGASGAEFEANRAAAELEAGRVDEAERRYRAVLRAEPGHDEASRALTRLSVEYRGGVGAFDHYRERAQAGRNPTDWLAWQNALMAHRKYADAVDVGANAERVGVNHPSLALNRHFADGLVGDAAIALREIERLDRGLLALPATHLIRSQLALRAGDARRAADEAERYVAVTEEDQSGWSLLSVAWRLLSDPREAWLCDYDRFVMIADVPDGESGLEPLEYARRVAATLDSLHSTLAAPGDQSLRHGTQTSGALFDRIDPAVQRFRRSVAAAAEGAIATLPGDGRHPFLKRNTGKTRFAGSWSVRLAGDGGHHVPHFHAQGWMSSAYYARLPDVGTEGKDAKAGWIEFGRPPAMFNLDLEPRRVVEPRPGRLVLFPSFLWHGTVPFPASGGDRLTAAFDFLPA